MRIVINLIILLFFNYYLLCKNYSKLGNKLIFSFFFIFTSIILRILIDPASSKDYIGYFEFYNFDNSVSLTSFLVSEPYLFLLYKFFEFFVVDKSVILVCVFWFNWVLCMYFFVWLAFRDDLLLWKKIILFAFYFFLFSFVVIRNAPVYIIYSYFFYYSYRAIKYKSIIITPFMHLSSLPFLLLFFHKEKNYFKYIAIGLLFFLALLIFKFLPIFENIDALESPLNKIDTYLEDTKQKGFFHQIYFGFISNNSIILREIQVLLAPSIDTLITGIFDLLDNTYGHVCSYGCPTPVVKLSPIHQHTLSMSAGHSGPLKPLELCLYSIL